MKHTALVTPAVLHLLAIAIVYVTVMPLLLVARCVIAVCAETLKWPVLVALALVTAWALWMVLR